LFNFLGKSLYLSTLCWLLGVDEVSGETWQLVIAIHDEGAELILDVKLPRLGQLILVMPVLFALVLISCCNLCRCALQFHLKNSDPRT
jgi:hypothetical protein